MKILDKKYFLMLAFLAIPSFAQDTDAEGEPTTLEGLLLLVQEGRTSEQDENSRREAEFKAEEKKQASRLAAEKRELARQERIAIRIR